MNSTARQFSSDELVAILALSKDATAIYTTENLIIQMANDAMIGFWGKDRSVIGKLFIDAVPELAGQPFFDLLREVWRTGVTYEAHDTAAQLRVNGELQWSYYDFIYRAIKDEHGQVHCILHTATDVTERHHNRQTIKDGKQREQSLNEELIATNEELSAANEEIFATNEELSQSQQDLQELNNQLEARIISKTNDFFEARAEAERQRDRLRRFFMQAPAGICILDGSDFVFELLNQPYQQIFPERVLLGKPLLEALPELKDQPVWEILRGVYNTGNTFEGKELLVPLSKTDNGPLEDVFFNFIYQARRDEKGNIDGILVFAIDVTDTVLNRRKIEENEASLRSLVMTSHYALMILRSRDWVIEIANQQIANLWQKKLPEITGRNLLEVLPEIEGQPFPALLSNVYDTGVGIGQEEQSFYLESTEGQVQKFVSFYYDPMLDAEGTVTGIIVACEDVTEKVKGRQMLEESYSEQQSLNEELSATNEELATVNEELAITNAELTETQASLQKMIEDFEESENRLHSIVESAPFPIGVYQGREMRIILANQSIMDVWGKGYNVIGKRYTEVLPELGNQEIFSQLDAVFTTGIPFHTRNQQVDIIIDGKLKTSYFNYSFTPLYDAAGDVYGILNTAADVTDLNLAKQKVEQSERNLHSMILQAPVAMCILMGPQHIITVANQLIIELWGKPAESVMNKPVFEALPDAREQGLEKLLADVYYTGETFYASEMPVSLLRNGKLENVYQDFVYQPYRDSDSTILGVIAITLDVTEQVLARQKIEKNETELLETKKRLELELEAGKQVQRKKDDFIGMASHELKTPLTSLTAIVQVANAKLKNSEDAFLAGAMSKANIQVKRMTSMINGFLNISRLESGKILIEKQKFPIDQLIRDMIDEIQLTAHPHAIYLNSCDATEVFADRDKIGSVISNLLSNAVKYSNKGKQIEVSCSLTDHFVQVSVKDQGIGVKEQDLEKLFDRYYRVESTDTKHIAGFGIGLYLSAEIIKQHDGRIWVESESGAGSTFHFSLPFMQ
jgi:two-component system sensor histidine kinase VicK